MHTIANIEVSQEKLASLCQEYGVKELALFGSRARGDHRLDSDLDVLVDFFPETRLGLIGYATLREELAKLFQLKVDLVTKSGLKPIIRDEILPEARAIYEAS